MRPILFALLVALPLSAQVLDPKMHHLRSGAAREWTEFPETAEANEYVLAFSSKRNDAEVTLRLRHRDLKQNWTARLNGKEIFRLPPDEKETVTCWPLKPGALVDGANELRIAAVVPKGRPAEGSSDDVMIGDAELIAAPRQQVLSAAAVEVVVEGDRNVPIPCRITVVNDRGALMDTGNASDVKTVMAAATRGVELRLAVRPGVVYAGDGRATLHLAAGRYTLYAGRGFEYSVDSANVELRPGDAVRKTLRIRRVVPTDNYVCADTHVHTYTYSRHGDASLDERMVTLAGEGIELPVATDHNIPVDYWPPATDPVLRQFYTPVIGEEVTTAALGHFNVFPLARGVELVDWRAPTWPRLGQEFKAKAGDGAVVILNHARDTHGNFRPFDPARHVSCTGEQADGVQPPANAMEVINSGSTQTDPMLLIRDWFGMLNHGDAWTPVGSSDSHDVNRYIVGQGRTYVRSEAAYIGNIDVATAVKNFRAGKVLVSYGLLADVTVADKYGAGDLVPAAAIKDADELQVHLRVLGPEWTRASSIALFANGIEVKREAIAIPAGQAEVAGVKWEATWTLPKPRHDVWLAAVATGPGIDQPFWPTAKPYQPTSPEWNPYVLAITGAVRIDADDSGTYESPRAYASKIVTAADGDLSDAIAELSAHDAPTAMQAASALRAKSPADFATRAAEALHGAAPQVRQGFEQFIKEWSQTDVARAPRP